MDVNIMAQTVHDSINLLVDDLSKPLPTMPEVLLFMREGTAIPGMPTAGITESAFPRPRQPIPLHSP